MIYITGDTHGDFSRIERFCEKFQPSRDDITRSIFWSVNTRITARCIGK